jgi:hypothetical protein
MSLRLYASGGRSLCLVSYAVKLNVRRSDSMTFRISGPLRDRPGFSCCSGKFCGVHLRHVRAFRIGMSRRYESKTGRCFRPAYRVGDRTHDALEQGLPWQKHKAHGTRISGPDWGTTGVVDRKINAKIDVGGTCRPSGIEHNCVGIEMDRVNRGWRQWLECLGNDGRADRLAGRDGPIYLDIIMLNATHNATPCCTMAMCMCMRAGLWVAR